MPSHSLPSPNCTKHDILENQTNSMSLPGTFDTLMCEIHKMSQFL